MADQFLSNVSRSCLNCENQLITSDIFCNKCGQQTNVERIDAHFLSHNIIHTLTHADKGIFHLIKVMTLSPGKVMSDYVAGKRKQYFNPFNFFFVTITISALLTNSFDLLQSNIDNPNAVSSFISQKFNLVLMISVPIISLFTLVLFRKSKYNFAENLVFHCFTGGYRIIFFVFLFALIVPFFRQYYYMILYLYLGCFTVYLIWAAYGFYKEKLWITAIKIVMAFVLTQFVITLLVFLGVSMYHHFL